MKPTRHAIRLIAAAASTMVTIVLFQCVALLAQPSASMPAAQSQAPSFGLTTSAVQS